MTQRAVEVCLPFADKGECRVGAARCHFSHDVEAVRRWRAMRERAAHQTCARMQTYGQCKYGDKCWYLHEPVATTVVDAQEKKYVLPDQTKTHIADSLERERLAGEQYWSCTGTLAQCKAIRAFLRRPPHELVCEMRKHQMTPTELIGGGADTRHTHDLRVHLILARCARETSELQ